jgi:hypothetical protein
MLNCSHCSEWLFLFVRNSDFKTQLDISGVLFYFYPRFFLYLKHVWNNTVISGRVMAILPVPVPCC